MYRILDCSNHLVENGFLHNDLHQGNIMMYKDVAVIIDLGLMIQYTPPKTDFLLKCVQFAQAFALFEHCNTNNPDIFTDIEIYRDRCEPTHRLITEHFSTKNLKVKDLKQTMKKIDQLSNDTIVGAQLLLACLYTLLMRNVDCATWVGDYIYAIRNPMKFTISQIVQFARLGIDLPNMN